MTDQAVDRACFDGVVVVGAGLAGMSLALAAAPRPVLLLSPTPLTTGSASAWAQGGLAAALGEADSPALHAADTLAAGAGLCDAEAVRRLTAAGPEAVRRLAALGAPFDLAADGGFVLSLEAAHSLPRVARVGGDGAGAAIMAALAARVRAAAHVTVREGARLLALLQDGEGRVCGVRLAVAGGVQDLLAEHVALATGGVGGLYAVTTDPPAVRGDGVAAALLAGAATADLGFVQFHPTAMDLEQDPAPLATEALRGAGAVLVNRDGRRFMGRYDAERLELAPRDVVARAIHAERAAGRGALLDARAAVGEAFPTRYPAVFAACQAAGLDPRRAPVPVAPAAHYHMGGIVAALDGRTSLEGLTAVGECARTGVHGANRLASNSLLEAAVMGHAAGLRLGLEAAGSRGAVQRLATPPELPAEALLTLRRGMSRDAGVVRDAAGLSRLLELTGELRAAHGAALPLVAAEAVAAAALRRGESVGAHFRSDAAAAVRAAA